MSNAIENHRKPLTNNGSNRWKWYSNNKVVNSNNSNHQRYNSPTPSKIPKMHPKSPNMLVYNGLNGNSSNNGEQQMISNNNNWSSDCTNNDNTNGTPKNYPKRKHKLNIQHQKVALPIYSVRSRLLELIRQNETLILIGETGSGKTTQLPQYIDEERLQGNSLIGVTQPRRVAATCVAVRVAQEQVPALTVGETVGYTVRFENVTSPQTRIKYMTDGILLREAISDKLLMKYNVILLDEAHERTIHTDVLFGIVKSAQKLRQTKSLPQLKIIIMSATMDVDHFSTYFNECPVVFVEGRMFPVQIHYIVQSQDDYQSACISTLFKIHCTAPISDDVLIFLTGQEEIESVAHQIRLLAKEQQPQTAANRPLRVCTLYAAQSHIQQMTAFASVPENTRKVIISTNIAETSLTIPGIKYIIDSGMVKNRWYHPATGLELLKVEPISQEQAWQRCGRAGRESEGTCYRLYTKNQFEAMRTSSVPEIQRANLNSIVLQLLALGINAQNFDFLDRPDTEHISAAFRQLQLLKAADLKSSDCWALTAIGQQMAQFPLNPQYIGILMAAEKYGCLEEALTVVSLLSVEAVLLSPPTKREEARAVRNKFNSAYGDLITLLNVYKRFHEVSQQNRRLWCHDHYLNLRNLTQVDGVRQQLAEICRNCRMTFSSCGTHMDPIRKCILAGLFTNVAELMGDKQYKTLDKKQTVVIHPSSVLHGQQPIFLIFTEVVHTSKCYLRGITTIEPAWISEIVPDYVKAINFHPMKTS